MLNSSASKLSQRLFMQPNSTTTPGLAKDYVALYVMCIYDDSGLNGWFVSEHPYPYKTKLDTDLVRIQL